MSFVVKFPHEEPRQFADAREVQRWAETERKFWDQFREAAGRRDITAAFSFANLDQSFARLNSVVAKGNDAASIQEALNRLLKHVDITSRSALGSFMSTLLETGQEPLTVLLVYVLHKNHEGFRQLLFTQQLMLETFLASYLLTGYRQQAHPLSHEAFINEFRAYKRESAESLRVTQEQLRELEKDREQWQTDAKEARDSHEAVFNTALDKFKNDLTETKEKYDKQFALQAPIAYWTGKAERHKEAAKQNRLWFYILLVAALIASGLLAWGWLLQRLSNNPNNFWPVVIFSAFVAALAWPVRLLAKFWLSQSHLYEDASERAVIAQTFLSLADNKTVEMSAEDRKILLAALFRDTTAGLVKDDHPVNVMDAIANAIGRR